MVFLKSEPFKTNSEAPKKLYHVNIIRILLMGTDRKLSRGKNDITIDQLPSSTGWWTPDAQPAWMFHHLWIRKSSDTKNRSFRRFQTSNSKAYYIHRFAAGYTTFRCMGSIKVSRDRCMWWFCKCTWVTWDKPIWNKFMYKSNASYAEISENSCNPTHLGTYVQNISQPSKYIKHVD